MQDNKPNEIILPTRSVEDPLVSSAEGKIFLEVSNLSVLPC